MTDAPQDRQLGFFLRSMLLASEDAVSEGIYDFDGWAVRLGGDPTAVSAKMASLHESYHGFLNDSTAVGTLLHAASTLHRARPDDLAFRALVLDLVDAVVDAHETYATFASMFVVGQGTVDAALLRDYPDYRRFLELARTLIAPMPNQVVAFQVIQSAARAAMQPDCLPVFAARGANQWHVGLLKERPNRRMKLLFTDELARAVARGLDPDGFPDVPGLRELLKAPMLNDEEYLRFIGPDMDAAVDAVGMRAYELCRDYMRAAGLSCLSFNGHQEHTAAILVRVREELPASPRVRVPVAAMPGTVDESLVARFAAERLVVTETSPIAHWHRLEDVPEERWSELLVGPVAHAQVVFRPARRVRDQYRFQLGCPPSRGLIAALRRRVGGAMSVVEFFSLDGRSTLERFVRRTAPAGGLVGSTSLSVMSDAYQAEWLDILRGLSPATVLVDTDPFRLVRRWHEQGTFDTMYSTITLKEPGRDHLVFALAPEAAGGLLFLAPCSSVVSSALLTELRDRAAAGGRFREDPSVVEGRADGLNLVLSHLMREEPWFDFRADPLD